MNYLQGDQIGYIGLFISKRKTIQENIYMINRMFPSLKNQWGIQQVEEKNYFVYKNKSLV